MSESGELITTHKRLQLHKVHMLLQFNVRNLEIRRSILKLASLTEMQPAYKSCRASLRLLKRSSSTFTRNVPTTRITTVDSIRTFQRAFFSTSNMALNKTPSSDPPKHEMVFFPNMTTSLPSESAEFRRVLWTGLYSQLVLMTVPVGGDIGDEVGVIFSVFCYVVNSCMSEFLVFLSRGIAARPFVFPYTLSQDNTSLSELVPSNISNYL